MFYGTSEPSLTVGVLPGEVKRCGEFMKIPLNPIQVIAMTALLVLAAAAASGQQNEQATRLILAAGETSPQVQLKLVDGSSLPAEEAWESEQGIWYRQGGMNHLISRDRIKRIDRAATAKPKLDVPVAKVVMTSDEGGGGSSRARAGDDQPVWIYLVGGARVEADAVAESASGAWYRRGSLSIFVERARIDHIAREEMESLAGSESSSIKTRGWTTGNQKIDGFIKQSGAQYGVDPYLVFCVMEQESHFNTRALSPKGARGLMQLMPGTSTRLGVRRPSDPAQNIAGGTRYLKQLMGQFNGRIDLVLASYNAGEGAVMKFGRTVPPYRETRDYVRRISYRYKRTAVPAKSEVAVVGATL